MQLARKAQDKLEPGRLAFGLEIKPLPVILDAEPQSLIIVQSG